jgi:hypothetical protein
VRKRLRGTTEFVTEEHFIKGVKYAAAIFENFGRS